MTSPGALAPESKRTPFAVRNSLLMALTFSSGAIDAISFIGLGKVFTAFMTGNIAFLGLSLSGAGGPDVLLVIVSILAFAVGVFVSTRIVPPSEKSDAWPFRVTVALALSLIAHAAFAVVWVEAGDVLSRDATAVLLGIWALAMGMQSAAVRRLEVGGVFTTAATATVIFLVGDLAGGTPAWPEVRRLSGVLVSLFAGAIAGGVLLVHAHPYAPLLPLVVTAAVVLVAAFGPLKREPSTLEIPKAAARVRHA